VLGSLLIARFGALNTLIGGLIATAAGSALRGAAPEIITLYAATILTGFGVAIMHPSLPPLVRIWLPHRIGFGTAVFTNGVDTFRTLLGSKHVAVHLLAGVYDRRTTNLVGPLTLRSLESLYFDVAVMSCAGLDVRWGATEATLEDAAVKQRMLEASSRKILAVDRSKLGLRGRARLAPIQAFDVLVTELDPNHKDLRDFRPFVELR